MKFLISDIIFSGSSVLVIAACSALLYADYTRKIEAGDLKQIGTITFKREVAQRKYQTQVVWEEVEQNFPVYNNDSIRTSELSEAVIHLHDGTDISIDENSMIMLSTMENAININFEHGSIAASRMGVSGADISAINIKSMDATVSVNKGNIQLTQLENSGLDLTVSEGSAKVTSVTDQKIVTANEKAVISADRKETKIVQLKFFMKEPAPNRYYVTDVSGTPVSFEWNIEGKFKNINCEISRERDFKKILKSIKIKNTNKTDYSLGEGSYFWRLAALNEETKKTEYSETRKFNIVYKKPAKVVYPLQNENISRAASVNSLQFKWADQELSSDYTLEVAADSAFTGILYSANTRLKNITLENVNAGKYFCRVKSSVMIGGEKFILAGKPVSFSIEAAREAVPPVLLSPENGKRIDIDTVKTKGLTLTWKSDPSYILYEVEIAKNSEFTEPVLKEKRTVNFAEAAKTLEAGKYFWRVTGNTTALDKKMVSSAGSFELSVKEKLAIVSPAQNEEVNIPADRKNNEIRFMWKKPEQGGNYVIHIADNPDFRKLRKAVFGDSDSGEVSIPESGEYYWRVILSDKKGKELQRSDTVKFTAKVEKAVAPGKTVLVVKAPVKGAKIYINSVFKGYSQVSMEVKPGEKINVRVTAYRFREYESSVQVSEGEVYTLTPAMQRSKDLERVKWISNFSSPVSSEPVYYKDRIIACSENGVFTVLNSAGGVVVSKKIASRIESRPVVYENNAYVVDVDGTLYSVEIITGKIDWKVKIKGPLLFRSEPLLAGGRLYLATGYGYVEAYDLKGKKIWENDLDEAIYNSIQVAGKNLIIATDELKLYALSLKDGDEEWSTPIDERVITLSPLIHNNNIYFGCYSGMFYSITADDGDIVWKYKAAGAIYSTPAVYQKSIYFGSEEGFIYSLEDTTGKLNWQFKTGAPVRVSPIFAFGNVIVADEQTVYALNPADGKIIWQNTFESGIKTSPVFAGDTVVIGLENGSVVSVRNDLTQFVK